MRVPEVRCRLIEMADETGIAELRDLAGHLYRRRPVRKAAPQSRPTTPELRAEIRKYAAQHPRATLGRIAQVFDTNPGRVSEALVGKRQ
jgi:hypothetical protein